MRRAGIYLGVIVCICLLSFLPGQTVPPDTSGWHLQPLSPCIDMGTWATTTVSAGSGTSMAVQSVATFYDIGEIQMEGTTEAIQLASVDTTANVLHLSKSITWIANQGVHQPYFGEAPDMGAFEFNPATDAPTAGFAVYVRGAGFKVTPGTTAEFMVSVRSFGGFAGKVQLSCTGLPAGVAYEFLTNPVVVPSNYFIRSRFRAKVPLGTALQTANLDFKGVEVQ